MSDERHLKQLNDIDYGRKVALAWDVFRELIDRRRTQLCVQITSAYREGKTPQDVFNLVAGLNAIEELERFVKQATTRGERAGKDLLNGSPRNAN
ncbi:MAG TPA: hypothetical protein VMZ26_13440 [Pyrinomonadaceae bacterium]|nr:hypothetical protein [Pyrinomonadaceae bacterium]